MICFVLEVVIREFYGTLFDQLKPPIVCLLYLNDDFYLFPHVGSLAHDDDKK